MKRREFIINTSLFSIGAVIAPRFTFGHKKFKIGIIGAGASGLFLAKTLKKQGDEITLFEAKETVGGRIASNTSFCSKSIDLGAQWIHGKNELYKIVMASGTPVYEDLANATIKMIYDGRFSENLPSEFYEFLKKSRKSTPLHPDSSIFEFAKSINSNEEFLRLIENIITDAATTADRISINEFSKVTNKLKTTDYQFKDTTMHGFFQKNFEEDLRNEIILNSPIKEIDYSSTRIKVTNTSIQSFEFDKVIITIPISALKSNQISFIPNLPEEKIKAFDFIGMDKGLKLFLKFNKKFYDHAVFNGKHAGYYIDIPKYSDDSTSVLASLVMGNHANKYYENPEKAIENYLFELDGYFNGGASKHFVNYMIKDWGNEPYINGVYSYTKPNGKNARSIARKSIDNKIFFAGEAMNTKLNYGNVHGAIESAMDVLKEIHQI